MRPHEDFYRFVNERWLATFEIPACRVRQDQVSELIEGTRRAELELIREAAARRAPPGSPQQILGAFHRSFMDTALV